MKDLIGIIKEQIASFIMVQRLAIYQIRIDNTGNYLGSLWEILNPAIQIFIYWFVFGQGIAGGREVDGMAFLPYLLVGISMWFFMNQGILEGTKAIVNKINMVAKMNFPLSALPSYVLTAKFYAHIILLFIVIIVINFYGFHPTWSYLQIPIMMFSAYMFVFAATLLFSTLAVLIQDIHMIVQSLMRIMFYLSPILWDPKRFLPESLQILLKLNPIHYIADFYRAALLKDEWFIMTHWEYTLYFWFVVLVLLYLGSKAHMKFRNQFLDYL
ncbi:ABC transporter permease [Macrococcoides canis]|uniref:ABC transporter permease n=1 Tax=Macrococcoides canis TaxID=1855823 RepID=UPI001B8C6FCB|nr:ABC transporter permease [Macrococcus canis]QUR93831.1 teichoic acid ABC transporter permease [Macrococcus canis]UTH07644.1 ABC transporter permease [Macrococcus canis]